MQATHCMHITSRSMIVRALTIAGLVACSHPSQRQRDLPPPNAGQAELAFEIDEGNIENVFYRQGPIAAHLLASSGVEPRLIVAFPAGNTGAGLWFAPTKNPVKFVVDGPLE